MLQDASLLHWSHLICICACQGFANGYFQPLASHSHTQLCWTALVLMLSLRKSQLILVICTWQKQALSQVFFQQNIKQGTKTGKKKAIPNYFNTPIANGKKTEEWSQLHHNTSVHTTLLVPVWWKYPCMPWHNIYWCQKVLEVIVSFK